MYPLSVFTSSRFRGSAAGLLLTSVTSIPAWADDSEVFFGQIDPTINQQPNVLLVLDTSSSMNRTDGVHVTRLERMKEALHTIIDSSTNVNMGLMRFNGSNGGGPILYPVTALDETVCVEAGCGEVTVSTRISAGFDDVEEYQSNNRISSNGNILSMGNNHVGLRFDQLNIPQGVTLTDARIEFTAYSGDSNSAMLSIAPMLSEDAPVFDGSDYEVSGRVYGTPISWSPDTWVAGMAYKSPDLSTTLQPIVNLAGWCGGQSVVLKVAGSGNRDAMSSEFSLSDAPRLSVTYDASSVPDSGGCAKKSLVSSINSSQDDAEQRLSSNGINLTSSDLEMPIERSEQVVGMRFADLNIPHGSTIESATIEFQVDEYETGNVTLSIHGEATDDATSFSSSKSDITNRNTTMNEVLWVNPPLAAEGERVISPDVTSIVQEVIDRSGWQAGNAIAFQVSKYSGSGTRVYESYNGDASAAPRLRVDFTIPSGTGSVVPTTITARDKLKEVVDEMRYTSGTPLVDAYYEASQYYLGGNVDYGLVRGYPGKSTNRVSHPDSYTGGTVVRDSDCTDADPGGRDCADEHIIGAARYISPMTSSCQTSHIVLLSDGGASSNSSSSKIRSLIGSDMCSVDTGHEACGRSLAGWLYSNDLSLPVNGKQNIPTYTVGFNLGGSSSATEYLRDIATAGGGTFHEADSTGELVTAFQSILGEVLSIDTSFVAPGATVNQFNRLTHRNDIYFSVFKPRSRPTWSGNLKRYEIGVDSAGDALVLDVNGNPAVDASSGYFDENSQSWWSEVVDGNQVVLGGAAAQLVFDGTGPNPVRRAFTFTGDVTAIPGSGVALTDSNHVLAKSNSLITNAMLDIQGIGGTAAEIDAHRDLLLDWARGIDVLDSDDDGDTTDWRAHMGDPMHSRPVLLNYGGTTDPQTTIFVSTNEGFLHAFDRERGEEIYSFIPQDLLPNLNIFLDNDSATRHPYGLDGAISLWTEDLNNDVTVNEGEQAYLYVGMRRGGNNYYAFDVSDRDEPVLKWIIRGGPGGTAGFEEMGESWSRMVPAKIWIDGSERQVLIFGGGYDTNQDPNPDDAVHVRTADTRGRGIFIVDAVTGKLVWSVQGSVGGDQFFSDMEYSIPSDIRVVDIDFDGLSDQMYVGDMGGQVWRFDFDRFHTGGDLLSGGVIANLSGTDPADQRRFYYEPDVALIGKGGSRFLSISIGSGWRAHPLDDVIDDRFYMLRVDDIYSAPEHYGKPHPSIEAESEPVTESDLSNVTASNYASATAYGWYIELAGRGEKVLGDSITINNQIIFTSYKPDTSVGACSTAIGGGSVYVLDVLNGSATLDMNNDGTQDTTDREQLLAHGGIPPEPVALITEYGPTILVGPEQPVNPSFSNLTQRSYWVDLRAGGESASATASSE